MSLDWLGLQSLDPLCPLAHMDLPDAKNRYVNFEEKKLKKDALGKNTPAYVMAFGLNKLESAAVLCELSGFAYKVLTVCARLPILPSGPKKSIRKF